MWVRCSCSSSTTSLSSALVHAPSPSLTTRALRGALRGATFADVFLAGRLLGRGLLRGRLLRWSGLLGGRLLRWSGLLGGRRLLRRAPSSPARLLRRAPSSRAAFLAGAAFFAGGLLRRRLLRGRPSWPGAFLRRRLLGRRLLRGRLLGRRLLRRSGLLGRAPSSPAPPSSPEPPSWPRAFFAGAAFFARGLLRRSGLLGGDFFADRDTARRAAVAAFPAKDLRVLRAMCSRPSCGRGRNWDHGLPGRVVAAGGSLKQARPDAPIRPRGPSGEVHDQGADRGGSAQIQTMRGAERPVRSQRSSSPRIERSRLGAGVSSVLGAGVSADPASASSCWVK